MKKILLVAIIALMTAGVYGQAPARVPAYRGMIERVQPNGDTIRTFLRGDERKHWMMMEDGWQIMEAKNGWLKYAKLDRKGKAVMSRRKARNVENRSKCEQRWLEKHGIKKN